MSAPTHSPEQILGNQLDPEDLSYVVQLCEEGFNITELAERDQYFLEVAELLGDLAASEMLIKKVADEKAAVEARAEEFKDKRAHEAALKMESRGFAEIAPSYEDQLLDDSRTKEFTYNNLPPHIESDLRVENNLTEIEGLRDLDTFLSFFLEITKSHDGSYSFPEDAEQAQSILENLTFIGEREYAEAARGLGVLWKNYLDADPKRKLCVLANVSNSDKYPGKRKSDDYLRERVFDTFSDEDKQKYAGRIFTELEHIEEDPPEDVRVVLLDDWTISGRQLGRVYRDIEEDPVFRAFIDSIEVNLLVASSDRLENGLLDPDDLSRPPVKVKAYYRSHHAEKAKTENKGHVSGLHSTVNFDFGDTIEKMIKRLDQIGIPYELPPLASVVRTYSKEKPKERAL